MDPDVHDHVLSSGSDGMNPTFPNSCFAGPDFFCCAVVERESALPSLTSASPRVNFLCNWL